MQEQQGSDWANLWLSISSAQQMEKMYLEAINKVWQDHHVDAFSAVFVKMCLCFCPLANAPVILYDRKWSRAQNRCSSAVLNLFSSFHSRQCKLLLTRLKAWIDWIRNCDEEELFEHFSWGYIRLAPTNLTQSCSQVWYEFRWKNKPKSDFPLDELYVFGLCSSFCNLQNLLHISRSPTWSARLRSGVYFFCVK